MLRDGASIFAILEKIGMASQQVYSPKNYADADYKQLFLFQALLVRSKNLIWLAIVEIYGIKQSGVSVARLPTRLLGEPNVCVTVRITRVSQRETPDGDGDWEWFGSFEKTTMDVEG